MFSKLEAGYMKIQLLKWKPEWWKECCINRSWNDNKCFPK